MSAATSDNVSDSDLIATPTAQEQLQLDAMFTDLFHNYSSQTALSMVVKLIHCIANGTAVEWLRQGVTRNTFYADLASFDLTNSNVDAKRIDRIRFDTTRTDGWGMSFLSHWAAQSDRHTPDLVSESFQLLKRSGGVTFQAASVSTKIHQNAYHFAIFSNRLDWVNCLLSEPTLNQGWNLPSQQQETPLLAALIRNESSSCEEMGLRIVPIMDDAAINLNDKNGSTLLYLATQRAFVSVLTTLLSRPELNMNPMRTVRSAMRNLSSVHQTSIIDAFDTVARGFAIVPVLIHEAVHNGWKTTLPIPLCTIIYHYYRTPYPRCECETAIAAAAPNKHSPYCFCFPRE